MADHLDAAGRLAEGRPAVDDTEEYVAACDRLGYQHGDLTAHAGQVREWYGSEDGLGLMALDADCGALSTAATTLGDAARRQGDLAVELSAAWSGRGAAVAHDFVWRSGHSAAGISAAVREAADALATLRDAVWQAVDAKVAAVEAIDGRHQAQRGEWLAAARTVTTGAGDLATASETIELQVKPFVHDEIAIEWLAAMRTATASIGGAYDAAINRISAGSPARFDIPGELGPRAEPRGRPTAANPTAAVASTPTGGLPSAAASFNPSAAPMSGPDWAAPAPPIAPQPVAPPPVDPMASPPMTTPAAATTAPTAPPLGDPGGGTSSLGSGLSGFGQQLADLIGGLAGSSGNGPDLADAIDGSDGLDDENDDEDEDDDENDEEDDDDEDIDEEAPTTDDEAEAEVAGEPDEEAADNADEPPVEASAPEATTPPPPLPAPAPGPLPEPADPTPCEIAADELPQVGE